MPLSDDCLEKLCAVGIGMTGVGLSLVGAPVVGALVSAAMGVEGAVFGFMRGRRADLDAAIGRTKKAILKELEREASEGGPGLDPKQARRAISAFEQVFPKLAVAPGDFIDARLNADRIVDVLLDRAAQVAPATYAPGADPVARDVFRHICSRAYDAVRREPEFTQRNLSFIHEALLEDNARLLDGQKRLEADLRTALANDDRLIALVATLVERLSGDLPPADRRPAPQERRRFRDIAVANFGAEVVEGSQHRPILFLMYLRASVECQQVRGRLDAIALQMDGRLDCVGLELGDPAAGELVELLLPEREVPTVYLFFRGQPIDGFTGPMEEEEIMTMIDNLQHQQG